ncbi:MAG: TonB-dependent receptor [Bacteroidales bacterium]|nr:TonB-dependent receptor [Bacteroidales bacterium]
MTLWFAAIQVIGQQDLLSLDVNVKVASTKGEKIFKTPSAVTIISKEQIENFNFSSISEALETVAGVYVTRTYLKRNLPTSRGILQDQYANKVLILINGIPSWNAVTGEGNLDRIGIHDVERIEVLKGPASVLYGTNAYSGAINIVLKSSDEMQMEAHMGYGSNASIQGGGNASGKAGDFSLFVAGNGGDVRQPAKLWQDGAKPQEEGIIDDHIASNNFTVHAGYQSHSLLINGFRVIESYLGVSPTFAAGANNDHIVQGTTANYTFDGAVTDKIGLRAGVTYDYGHRDLSRKKADDVRAKITGERINGFAVSNISLTDVISLDIGADYEQRTSMEYSNYDPIKDSITEENNMKDKSVSEYSVFGQLNLNMEKISAVAGARYTNNEFFGSNVSPRATVVYSFNETNSLKLLYGESFRAPSLFELYFETASKTVFGNTRLDPERSRSIEFAYLTSFSDFFIQALVYQGWYSDKIFRSNDSTLLLPDGTPNVNKRSVYDNGVEFTANGIELEVRYANPDILNAFLSFNYLLGNDEDKDADENYNFKYVPEQTLTLGLSKNFAERFNISGVLHYMGETEGPKEKIGAQQMINLNLSYRHKLNDLQVQHSFVVKNLLDENIEIPEYVNRKSSLNAIPYGTYRYLGYTLTVKI